MSIDDSLDLEKANLVDIKRNNPRLYGELLRRKLRDHKDHSARVWEEYLGTQELTDPDGVEDYEASLTRKRLGI